MTISDSVFPVLNQNVVDCLDSIPFQYRINKQIQRWILKNSFPQLWNIPYYNSLLHNRVPFGLHNFGALVHFFDRSIKAKLG